MVEKKNKYETIFILDAALEEEKIAELVSKFKTMIEKAGTVESVDEWGKRRLAYPINDKVEGYYVLINFEADTSFPKELERVYKITEGVLRDIVVRRDQ